MVKEQGQNTKVLFLSYPYPAPVVKALSEQRVGQAESTKFEFHGRLLESERDHSLSVPPKDSLRQDPNLSTKVWTNRHTNLPLCGWNEGGGEGAGLDRIGDNSRGWRSINNASPRRVEKYSGRDDFNSTKDGEFKDFVALED
ncbi:hypothetical protein JTE90_000339 [Oedothorax gibbosus]|uniref:Uncharacterized protein n=1 Tax=Oedothorax gibbosus TaxID=931172 RepID=A0AAV6U0M6_9ARAC|nr:hypothetical protein JTE90_000339 [Oedothorax gibbosus]